ncbi:MAG: hypothetical protein ACRCUF_18110 [Aeromonas sobria]
MDILKWIEKVGGPAKAADLLKETPRTVASWFYGEKLPKPTTACKIVKLTKGEVDYNGVYAPLIAKMAEKEAKALLKKDSK